MSSHSDSGLGHRTYFGERDKNKFDTSRNLNKCCVFPHPPSLLSQACLRTRHVQWNPTSSDVPVIIQHMGGPNQDQQRLIVYMQLTAGVWVRPQSPAQINRNSRPTSTFVNEKKCFLLYIDEGFVADYQFFVWASWMPKKILSVKAHIMGWIVFTEKDVSKF